MEITIRRANDHDAVELSQLIRDNASELLAPYYTKKQWDTFTGYYSIESVRYKISKQAIFCAVLNNKIVGSIGIDNNMVVGFYTHLNYLNRGIGTRLLNHIEAFAFGNGSKKIQLAASPAGLQYYLNRGWKKIKNINIYHYGVAFEETLLMKHLG